MYDGAVGIPTRFRLFQLLTTLMSASVDDHSNERDVEIPDVANEDVERHANTDTASAGPMQQEDLSEFADCIET
jgi:hypothetical protein